MASSMFLLLVLRLKHIVSPHSYPVGENMVYGSLTQRDPALFQWWVEPPAVSGS